MPVDVPADSGACQQAHVVTACEQADVVDLRHSGRPELQRPREQVAVIIAGQRVIEGAIDLVQVHIGRCVSGCPPRRPAAIDMNGLDEPVELRGAKQPWPGAICRISADIDDADPVVGVKHGHRVRRPMLQPGKERPRVRRRQRVQDQRRQGEVVHIVDLPCDLDLVPVVGVHFDQDFQAPVMTPGRNLIDELERVRCHERGHTRRLDRVADRIEPDVGHARRGEPVEDAQQVRAGRRVADINVDLLRCEGRPDKHLPAVGENIRGERQPRARPVQAQQCILGGPLRERGAVGEEHPGEWRVVAPC